MRNSSNGRLKWAGDRISIYVTVAYQGSERFPVEIMAWDQKGTMRIIPDTPNANAFLYRQRDFASGRYHTSTAPLKRKVLGGMPC